MATSYLVSSNPVYVTHINKGLDHTQKLSNAWEFNGVIDRCIDHKGFERIPPIFQIV